MTQEDKATARRRKKLPVDIAKAVRFSQFVIEVQETNHMERRIDAVNLAARLWREQGETL